MASAESLSVILPTSGRAIYLELTLESWARQRRQDFELIVVDDWCTDETPALVDRYRARLNLRYLRQERRGRGAAFNLGARAAEGDHFVFADESRIVARDHLDQLVGAADEVTLGPREGVLSVWHRHLPGVTSARALGVLAANPQLGAALGDEPRRLFDLEELARDVDAVLARFRLADPLWDLAKPIVAEFSDELRGCDVPWLVGMAGGLSVARAAAFDAGLFDETVRGWGSDDADFPYRLHKLGLKFRVRPSARSGLQARQDHFLVSAEVELLRRFIDKHDPVDAWILHQFLTKHDAHALAALAAARRPGSSVDRMLVTVTQELVRHLVDQLAVW